VQPTDDQITVDAAHAIRKFGIGVGITPDKSRMQYAATDFVVPDAVTLTMTFTRKNGGKLVTRKVFDFPDSGIAMGMYNLDESNKGFARSSFNYGLQCSWPVYLSTKNTILKVYDWRFKDLFQEGIRQQVHRRIQKTQFVLRALADRRNDSAGAKRERRLCLGQRELRWDVQSDILAQGLGSVGIMTSVLMTSYGKTIETEAAHGTVTASTPPSRAT
jgi:isocitrate dehydrogenase